MTTQNTSSSVYHIVMFSFAGSNTAQSTFNELKASNKLQGLKLVAQGIVERDGTGKVKFHEPGKGGVGATAGIVAGGIVGLIFAPVTILGMAVAGGALGGIAGHFAGRAIPPDDLKKIGNALPLNSSAILAIIEDTEAERIMDDMKDYQANIVTITLGDELSGEIDQYILAEVQSTADQPAAAKLDAPAAAAAPPAAPAAKSDAPPKQ